MEELLEMSYDTMSIYEQFIYATLASYQSITIPFVVHKYKLSSTSSQ